jgi:AraC-like DNA-binding protein
VVKNGQVGIDALPYRADVGVPPGVEILDFQRLTARAARHGVDPYQVRRPAFHELIAVRSGSLLCSLDFTVHELGPGSWLWIRPGQVHRYNSELRRAEGLIVLFLPGFLGRATAEAAGVDQGGWPSSPMQAYAVDDTLWQMLDLLEREYDRWREQPSETQLEVLRHLLAVLLLRMAARGGEQRAPEGGGGTFARFRAAVEEGFARSHRVEDYSGQLGYSVRTLTRATQAAAGCGAKRFIDDRVLLEAKRLLAHTSTPTASIAQQLGFPGATVFTKFFRQRTGQAPTEFRADGG